MDDIASQLGAETDMASTRLYFGPWYRRSPFFESTLRAGCKAYDIYNKMYLPAEYDDPEVEYWALNDGVTLWDVGVERTVEVSGPDADRLIDMLTCRDLTRCAVGQGKYMLVTAPDGGILNDPVLLHVDENTWWMQLADGDAGLYALGVLSQTGLDARGQLSRCASRPGAGAEVPRDAGEARRRRDLRPSLLLVRALRHRRHPRRHQPHGLVCRPRASRSTSSTGPVAPISGTRSWPRARSMRFARSRRAKRAGSRRGSSTSAPT